MTNDWQPIEDVPQSHGQRWLGWSRELGHFVTEWFDGIGWVFTWNQEPASPEYVQALAFPRDFPLVGKRDAE